MIRVGNGNWLNGKRGLGRGFLILAAGAFVFMSLAGLMLTGMSMSMSMGMGDDMQGNMQGCPFMIGTSICHMSLFEHIAKWQAMFASTGRVANILLALFSALVFVFFLSKYFYPPPRNFSTQRLTRSTQEPSFAQSLLEAFSAGILNPKLF